MCSHARYFCVNPVLLHRALQARFATAGLKKWSQQSGLKGLNLAAILSGANLNFDRLRYVAERTALGEKKRSFIGSDH